MKIRSRALTMFKVAMQKQVSREHLIDLLTEVGVPENAHIADAEMALKYSDCVEKITLETAYTDETSEEAGKVTVCTTVKKPTGIYTNSRDVECKISVNGQLKKTNCFKLS